MVAYAKEHRNTTAEHRFGPQPTERMIWEWRRQEDKMSATNGKKVRTSFSSGVVKWPELEVELKTWVVDH